MQMHIKIDLNSGPLQTNIENKLQQSEAIENNPSEE